MRRLLDVSGGPNKNITTIACCQQQWQPILFQVQLLLLPTTINSLLANYYLRIRDFSPPKTRPEPKILKPQPQNPKRKLIIQNSKNEFVWDESSDSHYLQQQRFDKKK